MDDKINQQTKQKNSKKVSLDEFIECQKRCLKNCAKKTDIPPDLATQIKKYKEKDPDFKLS